MREWALLIGKLIAFCPNTDSGLVPIGVFTRRSEIKRAGHVTYCAISLEGYRASPVTLMFAKEIFEMLLLS